MAQMTLIERLEALGRGEHLDLADIVCADAIAEIGRLQRTVTPSARPCPICDGLYEHRWNCTLNQRS